ncbi:MAG: PaaI family thioesterase [Oscillospiraceae bacterium]|jgi:acyl-CoA thioesterase|nr:PaaI family thioesterase [Oscillospiraceae bacterium]
MEDHLQVLRDFFAADKFAAGIGIVIDNVTDKHVVCSLELNDSHHNAGGGVQGGAIFTLADLTFAIACNTDYVFGKAPTMSVGASCTISYLKATRGTKLFAESTTLNQGRTLGNYRINVRDDLGIEIAEVLCTSCRLPRH